MGLYHVNWIRNSNFIIETKSRPGGIAGKVVQTILLVEDVNFIGQWLNILVAILPVSIATYFHVSHDATYLKQNKKPVRIGAKLGHVWFFPQFQYLFSICAVENVKIGINWKGRIWPNFPYEIVLFQDHQLIHTVDVYKYIWIMWIKSNKEMYSVSHTFELILTTICGTVIQPTTPTMIVKATPVKRTINPFVKWDLMHMFSQLR